MPSRPSTDMAGGTGALGVPVLPTIDPGRGGLDGTQRACFFFVPAALCWGNRWGKARADEILTQYQWLSLCSWRILFRLMRLLVIEASATLVTNLVKRSRSRAFAFQSLQEGRWTVRGPQTGPPAMPWASAARAASRLPWPPCELRPWSGTPASSAPDGRPCSRHRRCGDCRCR